MDAYQRLCQLQAEKWECEECTLLNDKELTVCASCNTEKNENHPAAVARESQVVKKSAEIPKNTSTGLFGTTIDSQKTGGNFKSTNFFFKKSPSLPNNFLNEPVDNKYAFGDSQSQSNVEAELKSFEESKNSRQTENSAKETKPTVTNGDSELCDELKKIKAGETGLLVFGSNSFGSLGLGDGREDVVCSPVLQKKSLTLQFKYVAAGALCMAGIDHQGVVWTWGPNDGGVLGRDTSKNSSLEMSPGKISLSKGISRSTKFVKVSVGDEHMVALDTKGVVYSWGSFRTVEGRIGHHIDRRGEIVVIQNDCEVYDFKNKSKFVDISSGCNHSVTLDENHQIFVFGVSSFSNKKRLRTDDAKNALMPIRIYTKPYSAKIKSVFCGSHTIYGIDEKNKLFAAGLNNFGQLGDGKKLVFSHKFSRSLSKVKTAKNVTEDFIKSSGGNHHALALTKNNKVFTFGRNASGVLGVATEKQKKEFEGVETEAMPSSTPLLLPVDCVDIAAGSDHNLVVTKNGDLLGFGYSSDGRIGLEESQTLEVGKYHEIIHGNTLSKVNTKIIQIGAGSIFSFALVKNMEVKTTKTKRKIDKLN